MEKQTGEKTEEMEKIWKEAQEIAPCLSGPDASVLQDRLESLSKKWHGLAGEIRDRRQKCHFAL